MGKCKNIECDNQTEGKRVYCSLRCRNVYVNKYLRDYSKIAESQSKEFTETYEKSPKFCQECDGKISYEKRRNRFCSGTCSSINGNRGRVQSEEMKTKVREQYFENNPPKDIITNCKNCDSNMVNSRRLYCSDECKVDFGRKHMDEFSKYKADSKFKFSLNTYPDEFNFDLIKEYGWYSPSNSKKPNLGGISRDHMISVREGFELGVDPELVAHPANCELMIHNENIGKNRDSSLSEEELVIKIKEWNSKYKN